MNPDMCNIDILYYTDPVKEGAPVPTSWMNCLDESCASDLVFPDDASDFLPPNPRLEMHAKFGNESGLIKINEKYSINLVEIRLRSPFPNYLYNIHFHFFLK